MDRQILVKDPLHARFKAKVAQAAVDAGQRLTMKEITERLIERWIQDPTIIEEATNGAQQ